MENVIGNLDTARVLRHAREIWKSEAATKEWLQSPVPALGGKAPNELLDTPEGRRSVSQVLLKIESGDFS
jgi:putative toxin-antitoxin system antitoxin component (TIGR02293 family)